MAQKPGLSDKVGDAPSIGELLWGQVCTFRTQRYVHVRNGYLAALFWSMAAGTLVYVLVGIFKDYEYLTKITPVGVVGGYGEPGSMYTGVSSLSNLKYCSAPYTNDYYETADWQYVNVGCTRYPVADVMLKRSPTYQFFTTLMYERIFTMSQCSTSGSCNAGTADVSQVDDSCQCVSHSSKYVANPEGMDLVLIHNAMVEFPGGTKYQGSSKDTTDKKIVTILRASNGTTVRTWETPDTIKIKLSEMLEMTGLDLDSYNYFATPGGTGSSNQYTGGNYPTWRMTGATLVVDMDYRNYDVPGVDAYYSGHDDKLYCVLTISHIGSWTSMGSESARFNNAISYQQLSGTNAYIYETQLVDRYRQGIKVVFTPHGNVGKVDVYAVINALLNGVVMLGIATTITTIVAKTCVPCGGFSKIYRKYQDVEVKPDRANARAAVLAASHASQFTRSFDRKFTGVMDKRMLFENLKIVCGEDLKDSQLAQVVRDVCSEADADTDGQIAVDEFTQFVSSDECDLLSVIKKYQNTDGDEDELTSIMELEADRAYLENLHQVQSHVHQINVAQGGQRQIFAPRYYHSARVAPAPPARFCKHCGKQKLIVGSNFCNHCGKSNAPTNPTMGAMGTPQQQIAMPGIQHPQLQA